MIDAIVLNSIEDELKDKILGGRIDKITQPERDELIIHIRSKGKKQRLLLSVQSSMPRVHITSKNKKNPATPPSFLMLLRKYIGSGHIVSINQYQMERILLIRLQQLNEMGDLCSYDLIIEIMGKHSNIILTQVKETESGDVEHIILDSIKRINASISRVRQVFPGLKYEFPPSHDKKDIRQVSSLDEFENVLISKKELIYKSIYTSFMGISPFIANHICYIANIDSNSNVQELSEDEFTMLYKTTEEYVKKLNNKEFNPVLLMDDNNEIYEFHTLLLSEDIPETSMKKYESVSELIDFYFEERSIQVRMKQKTYDLRRLINNNIERCYKKLNILLKQMSDTKNLEKYKIKGELILANQYMIKEGMNKVTVLDYYTNKEKDITLDPLKSAVENANKAFNTYNKKKRTKVAVAEQIEKTELEIKHLESVKYSVESIKNEDDIEGIKRELMETGYVRFKRTKKKSSKSKPHHYISSDGYDIYVGKNNLQNEELSMKVAGNSDWWFHAKDMPGSHVILKARGEELPDRAYEEAAALAGYYSKGRNNKKVSIDYVQKKQLKKPAGSAPGYVIYHTNYSMYIEPKCTLEEVK